MASRARAIVVTIRRKTEVPFRAWREELTLMKEYEPSSGELRRPPEKAEDVRRKRAQNHL
jgi:hypothetical protein